jgi:hypothetical protein
MHAACTALIDIAIMSRSALEVRPSRFAALSLEQDSDDDEEAVWQEVPRTKSKMAHKKGPLQTQGEDGKGLSKNAKKRARKRKNKSTSSDQEVRLARDIRLP